MSYYYVIVSAAKQATAVTTVRERAGVHTAVV